MSWHTGQIIARLLTGQDPAYPIQPLQPRSTHHHRLSRAAIQRATAHMRRIQPFVVSRPRVLGGPSRTTAPSTHPPRQSSIQITQ